MWHWVAGIAPADCDSLSLLQRDSCVETGKAGLGIGWEDAALRELAGKWHRLTLSVRQRIMELARSEDVSGRELEAG